MPLFAARSMRQPHAIHDLTEYPITNDAYFAHQNMNFDIITDNAQLLKTRK